MGSQRNSFSSCPRFNCSPNCKQSTTTKTERKGSHTANSLYSPYKEHLMNKIVDMNSDAIAATLIDSADYTFSAAHDEYSGGATDVATAAKVAVFNPLTSPTIVNGVFDTADFAWVTVTGDVSEAIVLWDDTTTSPVDLLIAFYDTGIGGMPVDGGLAR